ncbi:prepilin-type N-terminal cleavage/methylation domain-containing protein [Aquimarina sp. AU474]|uniref:prepilin-type N-terminal cleavage/methylation domain-containing protein n=1 Tax=Aquimarina sp. AU474 TaxID=2108529 RepID=UPI000D696663|nr:prepilin-type N-terminal cleavage/methylation domain-containing protein [Aquimarina sp. AU474]
MINYHQKIKAFTLTEVMVVIVISAIVVGLAFSILGIVQRNMSSIEDNYAYQSEMQSLEVALTLDFNTYTSVQWNAREEILKLSSPLGERQYIFSTDSITTDIDSYLIKTKSKLFYFEGEQVNSGRIDAVKLTFDKTTDLHRIFVFKHNDPTIHF